MCQGPVRDSPYPTQVSVTPVSGQSCTAPPSVRRTTCRYLRRKGPDLTEPWGRGVGPWVRTTPEGDRVVSDPGRLDSTRFHYGSRDTRRGK